MKETIEIEGFILAGGASSRMGCAKADLILDGKTFVDRAADALEAVAARNICIVGNAEQNSKNLPVVPDVIKKNSRGSIIGLYTALYQAEARWAAILACDLPFVTGELFERLVFFSNRENCQAVVPIQPDGRTQPLCALYKSNFCLPVIEKMLGENDWSLQKLLSQMKTRYVEFAELSDLPYSEHFFFNVNTPEEFARAQEIENLMKS